MREIRSWSDWPPGVAAMVKPSGLAVLAAFGIALIFRRRRILVHAAAAAAGLAIPLAATLAYFHAADLFAILPAISRQIADYAANSPWEPWDLSKPVIVILILGFPMLVRGYIFRRPQHRESIRPDRIIAIFAILWLTLEAAGIVAQRRMYSYHFLVLAAPASLVFGLIPRISRPVPLAAALTGSRMFFDVRRDTGSGRCAEVTLADGFRKLPGRSCPSRRRRLARRHDAPADPDGSPARFTLSDDFSLGER